MFAWLPIDGRLIVKHAVHPTLVLQMYFSPFSERKCHSLYLEIQRAWSWPLGYWDRGFESRSRHGRLSAFCVVLCRQRPCNGLITRPRNTAKCLNRFIISEVLPNWNRPQGLVRKSGDDNDGETTHFTVLYNNWHQSEWIHWMRKFLNRDD
jgi:hypothetical protein